MRRYPFLKKEVDEANTTNLSTKSDVMENIRFPFSTILNMELKKKYNNKIELLLSFTSLRWDTTNKKTVTTDERNVLSPTIHVYNLPDSNSINSITLGVNYFYDE